MNIHEYQAKELFDRFQVPSPKGKVASTAKEAHDAAKWLGVKNLVVKAQVHAGGRGKGVFKNGFKGGVHLVESAEAARDVASQMLGEVLVTKQTGDAGRLVRKVMIAESVTIRREIYLAILMDRETCQPVIVVSTEGGMDIEEVAANSPEKILREYVNPLAGLQAYQVRKIC
ncbi:acetate--CoA ligase family protein, partial [bacterium]|nr:acetate--CoA ligase family protein [bacterium]